MIYEYNKKFYVKPFSNKIVEVNVSEVTLQEAYEKSNRIGKSTLDEKL